MPGWLDLPFELAILIYSGTHDIRNATVTEVDTEITVETEYFEHSNARGALYIFVFYNASRVDDTTKANYLALDRNASLNYTLPFNLSARRYSVFDIESDGTLASGVGYPAVSREIVTNTDFQGRM